MICRSQAVTRFASENLPKEHFDTQVDNLMGKKKKKSFRPSGLGKVVGNISLPFPAEQTQEGSPSPRPRAGAQGVRDAPGEPAASWPS